MRVLVCGSRHFQDYKLLSCTLRGYDDIELIIHGAAKGADTMAGRYGVENGLSVKAFPADWNRYGHAAGPIRNGQMLSEGKPDLVIAFLADDSIGTKNMIDQARRAGVNTQIVNI